MSVYFRISKCRSRKALESRSLVQAHCQMSELEDLSMDDLLYASQSERKDGGEGDEDDEQPTTSSGGIPITVDRYVCTQGTNGEGRVQTCGQLPMG